VPSHEYVSLASLSTMPWRHTGGNECIAPCILNHSTRWRWVVSFMFQCWSDGVAKRKKFHPCSCQEMNPSHPACTIVSILTKLPQLDLHHPFIFICPFSIHKFHPYPLLLYYHSYTQLPPALQCISHTLTAPHPPKKNSSALTWTPWTGKGNLQGIGFL